MKKLRLTLALSLFLVLAAGGLAKAWYLSPQALLDLAEVSMEHELHRIHSSSPLLPASIHRFLDLREGWIKSAEYLFCESTMGPPHIAAIYTFYGQYGDEASIYLYSFHGGRWEYEEVCWLVSRDQYRGTPFGVGFINLWDGFYPQLVVEWTTNAGVGLYWSSIEILAVEGRNFRTIWEIESTDVSVNAHAHLKFTDIYLFPSAKNPMIVTAQERLTIPRESVFTLDYQEERRLSYTIERWIPEVREFATGEGICLRGEGAGEEVWYVPKLGVVSKENGEVLPVPSADVLWVPFTFSRPLGPRRKKLVSGCFSVYDFSEGRFRFESGVQKDRVEITHNRFVKTLDEEGPIELDRHPFSIVVRCRQAKDFILGAFLADEKAVGELRQFKMAGAAVEEIHNPHPNTLILGDSLDNIKFQTMTPFRGFPFDREYWTFENENVGEWYIEKVLLPDADHPIRITEFDGGLIHFVYAFEDRAGEREWGFFTLDLSKALFD